MSRGTAAHVARAVPEQERQGHHRAGYTEQLEHRVERRVEMLDRSGRYDYADNM